MPFALGRRSVAWRAAILVLLLVGSASAVAQEGSQYRGTDEQRVACTGDVFRLCWSEIPNVTAIVGCLKRERPRLSEGCRAVFDRDSRIASNRWQRNHGHMASATTRSEAAQSEGRGEPAAPIKVAVMDKQPDARSTPTLANPQHQRSKVASRGGHNKHRVGRLHKHPAVRHHLALATTKLYRHHD
jgi:hypothetical protein